MNTPATGRNNSLRQCECQRRDMGRVIVVRVILLDIVVLVIRVEREHPDV
jgi:hypothetical protein